MLTKITDMYIIDRIQIEDWNKENTCLKYAVLALRDVYRNSPMCSLKLLEQFHWLPVTY